MKLALVFLLIQHITLSFSYRETNPSMLFPYTYAASDEMPLGNLSNPSYLPLWQTFYLNADYAKPYTLGELNAGSTRLGFARDGYAAQAAYSSFGIDEYMEDTFSLNAGYMPFKVLSLGAGASYYHVKINTDEINYQYGVLDYRFAFLLMPFDWMHISYLQENIKSVFTSNDLLYPERSFGIHLKPAQGIGFSWNLNKVYYGYINTFCVNANLLPQLSLKGGYSRETSSYAFSVNVFYDNILFSYGLTYHSYLGLTHKAGLTFSTDAFSYEQVNYNKKLISKTIPRISKKININECSDEEIRNLEIIALHIRERIIIYRKNFGPVTKKALVQLGISEAELKQVLNYISGLAVPNKHNIIRTKKSKHKGAALDTRKILFGRLLDAGLGASRALNYADLAKKMPLNEIINEIRKSELPDEQKAKAIKICKELL